MEKDAVLNIDGQLFKRDDAIYLLEKHWEMLPIDIQNELLLMGIGRKKIR